MKKGSITYDLRKQIIVPIIFLSISVIAITVIMLYTSVKKETQDGLSNLAHSLKKVCDLQAVGDYSMENGVLMKGRKIFDENNSIVDDVFYVSGVDATIFWKDERVLTSIRESSGDRAIGTKASDVVVETVLQNGEEYFSQRVRVNNIPYFGYYIPLKNSDESIVGMVFVGKSCHMIIHAIAKTMLMIFAVILIIVAATLFISFTYSSKIISCLSEIRKYLGKVAEGDIKTKIDVNLLERTDEIGEMGRFAEKLQKNITELVGTDVLTGLYNRRSGILFLENVLRERNQYGNTFGVVIGDIDNFKNINDEYGHMAGDTVLKALADAFTEHMNKRGLAVRWGGEEFLFIYERMEMEKVKLYVEELREAICKMIIPFADTNIKLTMTFGISFGKEKMTVDEIINEADENLYCGKENGKNCVRL